MAAPSLELERLVVRLVGDTTQYTAALRAAQAQTQAAASRIAGMGRQLTFALTAPILVIGALSVREFAKFEGALGKIEGLVGISHDKVVQFSSAILDMAPAVGKAPLELAEALYFITSSGIKDTALAMDILRVSARASAAGLGTTQVVANVVTSAMNAYGHSNITAARATDILVAAVREGKAEGPDFAAGIGRVIPIASAMGLAFDQVAATMASLTLTGAKPITSAIELANVLVTLLKPTKEAEKALTRLSGGRLSFEGLRRQLRTEGILSVLGSLKEALGNNIDEFDTFFGNQRSLRAVLSLMGPNLDRNKEIFFQLAMAVGDTDRAFAIIAETTSFKWLQALAAIKVAMITLGEVLAPIAVGIAFVIVKLSAAWRGLSDQTKQGVAVFLSLVAAIGPVMLFMGLLGPIFMVGMGNMVMLTGRIMTLALVFGRFGLVMQALRFWPLTLGVLLAIRGFMVLTAVTGRVSAALEVLKEIGVDIWERIRTSVLVLWVVVYNLGEIIEAVWNLMVDQIKDAINIVRDFRQTLASMLGSFKEADELINAFTYSFYEIARVFTSTAIAVLTFAAILGSVAYTAIEGFITLMRTLVEANFNTSGSFLYVIYANMSLLEAFVSTATAIVVVVGLYKILGITIALVSAILSFFRVQQIALIVIFGTFRLAILAVSGILAVYKLAVAALTLVYTSVTLVLTVLVGVFKIFGVGMGLQAVLAVALAATLIILKGGLLALIAVLVIVKGAVWLVNVAFTAMTAATVAQGVMAIVSAFVQLGIILGAVYLAALAVKLIIIGVIGTVWSLYSAGAAGFGALFSSFTANSRGIIAVGTEFGRWRDTLRQIANLAMHDMPAAWAILQAQFEVTVMQLRRLWPSLWNYISTGFGYLATIVSLTFQKEFSDTLNRIRIELSKTVFGYRILGITAPTRQEADDRASAQEGRRRDIIDARDDLQALTRQFTTEALPRALDLTVVPAGDGSRRGLLDAAMQHTEGVAALQALVEARRRGEIALSNTRAMLGTDSVRTIAALTGGMAAVAALGTTEFAPVTAPNVVSPDIETMIETLRRQLEEGGEHAGAGLASGVEKGSERLDNVLFNSSEARIRMAEWEYQRLAAITGNRNRARTEELTRTGLDADTLWGLADTPAARHVAILAQRAQEALWNQADGPPPRIAPPPVPPALITPEETLNLMNNVLRLMGAAPTLQQVGPLSVPTPVPVSGLADFGVIGTVLGAARDAAMATAGYTVAVRTLGTFDPVAAIQAVTPTFTGAPPGVAVMAAPAATEYGQTVIQGLLVRVVAHLESIDGKMGGTTATPGGLVV